ncbi:TRAP transporter small permease [Qingshengfaniella alkalisoli]|uniref:TRAP transporter small permease protein n=1 Tax=Qingshengfaniella alkalisoli TaxID=2599296 RepID=A0A5B8IAN9_9RHOB|nr:TRAP transporter small permease [Qingshengfaniella alkalisoli]QDY71119.1 TRAP transporter small permease [Qingshengfaniella alkalisoli]
MGLILLRVANVLQRLNTRVLWIGTSLAAVAITLMVVAILVQVFFRYVLNSALPWPEEAARFLMLWMTGLAAPAAYRRGAFVSIDLLEFALPRRVGAVLSLLLLLIALAVLGMALQFGWKHVQSGWLFNSSSLKLPLGLIGMKAVKIKLAWMYMSLFVGFAMLAVVNIELILRSVLKVMGRDEGLDPLPVMTIAEAE